MLSRFAVLSVSLTLKASLFLGIGPERDRLHEPRECGQGKYVREHPHDGPAPEPGILRQHERAGLLCAPSRCPAIVQTSIKLTRRVFARPGRHDGRLACAQVKWRCFLVCVLSVSLTPTASPLQQHLHQLQEWNPLQRGKGQPRHIQSLRAGGQCGLPGVGVRPRRRHRVLGHRARVPRAQGHVQLARVEQVR